MTHRWNLPIIHNPLQTKQDLQAAFTQLTDPLRPFYSKGKSRLYIGNTGTSYTDEVAGFEGFSRILWGLAPLLAGGGDSDLWDMYIEGIRNGMNPAHEEYWGSVNDYDQRLVEMAALGLTFVLVPERIQAALSSEELQRAAEWLGQINDRHLYDCNWLLFRVMVQIGFKQVGLPYQQHLVDEIFTQVERFYLQDGWYSDGVDGHSDYYVPFAIHYYALIYAKVMKKDDPERSELFINRAAEFAKQFVYWFAEDGSALPYGRSLAYRFSQAAFWSSLVCADVSPFPLGVMKGLIMRNLRWWFTQPIFQADGVLTIGYSYSNLVMAENYNSPGSPYWAMKTFLLLSLPDDHPFWAAEEEPLPALKDLVVMQQPHLVLCRHSEQSHVLAFNSGHLTTNEHTHTSAKYEKFVYSTFFGFSVPRAEWGLAQGAFDSTLALSEGDNLYRVKRTCKETHISESGIIHMKWSPWTDVEVQTWLIPGTPWHIRVHRINSARSLEAAEGGFALGTELGRNTTDLIQTVINDDDLIAWNTLGLSGVKQLIGPGKVELIQPNANTNIIHPRTVIPTIRTRIQPGITTLASAIFGEPNSNGNENHLMTWHNAPHIEIHENKLLVYKDLNKAPVFQHKLG